LPIIASHEEERTRGPRVPVTVKNVYLLPDEGPHWSEIEEYLRGVNANVIRFRDDIDLEDLKEVPPDIFVVSEKSCTSLLSFRLRRHAMIVVGEEGEPGSSSTAPDNPKAVTIVWPMASDDFLKLSADLASLPERRMFRALLRIFPGEGGSPCIGRSLDFSHSGMSLQTGHHLARGTTMEISLSLPNLAGSIRLPIQIVRSSPGDGETVYGARFVDLDEESRRIIDEFIMQA
jgi:hypothetical protein